MEAAGQIPGGFFLGQDTRMYSVMHSPLLSAIAFTFLIALCLVRLLCGARLARLVVDVPNNRSLHTIPTPRTGGIGLMLAAGMGWLLYAGGALTSVAALAALLALIFLIDDVRSLPVLPRFAAQFTAAIAFVAASGPYSLWLVAPLVLGTVWSSNLYNFMDGSNGFAGGMTVFGFASYAAAASLNGNAEIAMLAAIVASAAAGFLFWNFDPARIFLGDAGSIPLGFLAATLGINGWHRGIWPFWLPLLVFSPFAVDATLTLFQRIRRGEKLPEAHRSHYYQRLVQSGWSHRRLALAAYALMAAASISAIALRAAPPAAVAALLLAWTGIYTAIAVAIDRRWAKTKAPPTADR